MITQFLRYGSLGLIFLTTFIPLYVNNSLFFPFITGKAFAFRIVVEIAFALWLLLMLREKKYAPRFSWLTVSITAFVAIIFVTDLLGLNPIRSLWSNFERMEGWVTLIHLWAYFIVATSLFGAGEEGRRMWHNFLKTSLVAASIVGIYGFFQLFGWAAIHQGSSRIDASLGNAAYMAVYMLFHVFIAWYLGFVAYEKRNRGAMWWYFILGAIFAFLLFQTATRGTILGLVGGVMLAFALYGIFGKGESKKSRWLSLGGIVAIIILGVGLVAAKDTAFVKSSESLSRLASISWKESTTQARGYIWPMAVKSTFSSPKTALIGVGQENFNYIFNANYNPEMWRHEQWFDRAHSVFLDWLVAGGLIGFLLYVALFIFAITAIWRSTISFKQKCLLTGLFVAYAIHNVFVFDNLASYLLFFTILGFVHTLKAGEPFKWLAVRDEPTENQIVVRDYVYFPIIAILFVATMYFINIRPYQANTRLIAAMIGCNTGTPKVELYRNALALNQYVANQEIREQLLSCASGVLSNKFPPELKTQFYTFAVQEIGRQVQSTPQDARAYVIGGSFLNNIGDWQNGLPLLEKAAELSPNKQSIAFELATNYMNTGKEKQAAALLEKAYLSAPEHQTAKVAYGASLILTGEEEKVRELFKDTPELWYERFIFSAYAKKKQYGRAIQLMREKIQKNPDEFQNYLTIASLYYQSGNKAAAVAELETAKAKFPLYAAQIDATIAEVQK